MKYHFIGIGGISMSALAAIMHARGHNISGSDIVANDQTRMLETLGIKIYIGHSKQNSRAADIIVKNYAIADDNPELANDIPKLTREQLLAEIANTYPIRIAVAGTHGKSTTTAMIAAILIEADLDPTVHNGAVMQLCHPERNEVESKDLGSADSTALFAAKPGSFDCALQAPLRMTKSNFRIGKSDIFLTEACEFKRSFLTLNPTIAVITNIDYDHVDCFKDLDDVKQSFAQFAAKAKTVIRTEDCPPINFALSIPGAHNYDNARAAAQVGRVLGVSEQTIKTALENYKGVDRRFQILSTTHYSLPTTIVSDYAHHPAELATTIQTAASLYKRFLIIFQPHTYTRTLALFDDFVRVLSTCDCVLYKTYAARELPIPGGRASDLATSLRGTKQSRPYLATPSALNAFIKKTAPEYDAIILTGAGDMQGKIV